MTNTQYERNGNMNLQAIQDAMNAAAKAARADYQVTIGVAIEVLRNMPPEAAIKYEDGKAPREAMSYRGYYSDLAFDDQENATAGEVLAQLRHVQGQELTGYKGGEYRMDDDTPIWRSQYGCASGVAWMGFSADGDGIVIQTKEID